MSTLSRRAAPRPLPEAAPENESTRVVILAGGRGTRLAPYTSILPKPLMPIGDRAILEIVVEQLVHHGFSDVVLSVGHLAHLIRAVFDHGQSAQAVNGSRPTRISYVQEELPLGTAGSLRLVSHLHRSFLVMNGDLLTTLDYADLLRRHREAGNVVTIATKTRRIKFDYGVLHLDDAPGPVAPVVGYEEKPEYVSSVSMGIYAVEPGALEFIPEDRPFDFPDLVHALLDAGQPVGSYAYDGLWFDIGRRDDYERALRVWSNGNAFASETDG
jgi:NDP-sugar pyrophosphorylase family protein